MASGLETWARETFARVGVQPGRGEVLAKILTPNDDSGRHGVLIPNEGYSFFPELPIPDRSVNATAMFHCWDVRSGQYTQLAWKYYQRYPERRVTRVNAGINVAGDRVRLAIFLRGFLADGQEVYAFDHSIEGVDPRFADLLGMLFSTGVPRTAGAFVRLPFDAPEFFVDDDLAEFLARFDLINARGWIRTRRSGDTGIGYTFETLIGVRENNDKRADFRGIEVKCKLAKESGSASGKTNLFQQGPIWSDGRTAWERLNAIGQRRPDGTLACYSQVTVQRNNLGLSLRPVDAFARVDLLETATVIGHWPYKVLHERLQEKHARAVFIKASARGAGEGREYLYSEVIYCGRPSIERFVELVGTRRIVFEFLMREDVPGTVRNRGYPWRLTHQSLLDHLFAVQVRLRGPAV